MSAPEPIVLTWAEWQADRARKRAILKAYGLEAPSRRQHGYGSAERRLQKAFGPTRCLKFVDAMVPIASGGRAVTPMGE